MTRDAFIQELRVALQGQIGQAQVNEQLAYYEKYIIEESRKGQTEEEVLMSLGSPRLIAKTIIQMYGSPVNTGGYREEARSGFETGESEEGMKQNAYGRRFRLRLRYGRLLSVLVFVLCLMLFVRIGILLLPFLASVFMVGAIGYVIFLIFSGNKK